MFIIRGEWFIWQITYGNLSRNNFAPTENFCKKQSWNCSKLCWIEFARSDNNSNSGSIDCKATSKHVRQWNWILMTNTRYNWANWPWTCSSGSSLHMSNPEGTKQRSGTRTSHHVSCDDSHSRYDVILLSTNESCLHSRITSEKEARLIHMALHVSVTSPKGHSWTDLMGHVRVKTQLTSSTAPDEPSLRHRTFSGVIQHAETPDIVVQNRIGTPKMPDTCSPLAILPGAMNQLLATSSLTTHILRQLPHHRSRPARRVCGREVWAGMKTVAPTLHLQFSTPAAVRSCSYCFWCIVVRVAALCFCAFLGPRPVVTQPNNVPWLGRSLASVTHMFARHSSSSLGVSSSCDSQVGFARAVRDIPWGAQHPRESSRVPRRRRSMKLCAATNLRTKNKTRKLASVDSKTCISDVKFCWRRCVTMQNTQGSLSARMCTGFPCSGNLRDLSAQNAASLTVISSPWFLLRW